MPTIRKALGLVAGCVLAGAQLMAVGPVAAVDPIRVDVCLADSNASPVVPGTTYYKIGSTNYFANTVDGTTSCKYQNFPAGTTNVEIWTAYNNTTSPHLVQNIASNPVFNFELSAITLRVEDASSVGVAGAQFRFGGPAGTAYYLPAGVGTTTDATGEKYAQMFPGTYVFNVGLNSSSATKSQDVGADPLVLFTTTTVAFGYSGTIAFGGPTGDSSWFTPAASREMFPGTTNFRFDFTNGPLRLPIVVGDTALTLSPIIARLINAANQPVVGVAVKAEPGNISLGVTDGNGIAYALADGLLGTETVSFTYGGLDYSLTQNQPTNSIYRFNGILEPNLTDLGNGNLWIGLRNSDDVGTNFDLKVQVLKNTTVIGTGEVFNVPGGSSGFNRAIERAIDLAMDSAQVVGASDDLSIKVFVRAGATGHRSGTARLWYGDATADSGFWLTLDGVTKFLRLRTGGMLSETAGATRTYVDVFVDRLVNGNAYKPFGTWLLP